MVLEQSRRVEPYENPLNWRTIRKMKLKLGLHSGLVRFWITHQSTSVRSGTLSFVSIWRGWSRTSESLEAILNCSRQASRNRSDVLR